MNPKPGALTAIQVILFIQSALAGLGLLIAFAAMGSLSDAQLQQATGMGSGGVMFMLLIAAVTTAFYVYVASTLGRGGQRTQTLVRVVVGLGFVSALINLLTAQSFVIALVITIAILILNEGETAKRWYGETENPTPHQSR